MHRTNVIPSLLLLYACLAPLPAGAADVPSRRSMADTMLNMMEAMGRFSRDYVDSRNRVQDGFTQTWESMIRDNGNRSEPSRGPEPPRRRPPTAATRAPLEGRWLGQGGERLMIRGSRFRLDAGPERRLEGLLQTRDRLLALHSPQHRKTWIYEYAEHEGRLVLRGEQGQLLLFRRVDPRDREPRGRQR